MTGRPSKRRRLDNDGATHKSSPAPGITQQKAKTPTSHVKQGTRKAKSSPASAPPATKSSNPDPHHAAWFAAKEMQSAQSKKARREARQAKAQAKKAEVDVYDDIDGAHDVGNIFLQRGVDNAPRERTTIFEQFVRKPAVQSAPNGRSEKVNGSSGGTKSGRQGRWKRKEETPEEEEKDGEDREDGGHDGEDGEEGEDEDEQEQEDTIPNPKKQTASQQSRKISQGKGWITATGPPKRTFEDEIRELEAKARQNVQEDSSDDELADEGASRRSSAKRPARREAAKQSEAKRAVVSSTKRKAPKPLDRRKADPEDQLMDDYEIPESDPEDRMEVDDPSPRAASFSARNEAVTPTKAASARPRKPAAKTGVAIDENHLQCLQRIVLEKAVGRRPIPLTNLQDEYAKAHTVINQTITAGESNSMLLIGARGSGKTALINQIIREQQAKHSDEFHVVRLNGFIHTDDKIALREIWRQLGREMELDEEEAASKNYADTMTRLLALLSHPTEMGMETDQITKSVIFVLDEFELFAGHPRQTLLYNLFDIAQSRKAPIAVMGLTTRIDVAESLEKRVKSRFSHRYVYLGMSKSLQAFEQICKSAMELQDEQLTTDEKALLGDTDAMLTTLNKVMGEVLSSDACSSAIGSIYYTTKSVPEFLSSLTFAVATLPTTAQTTASVEQHLAKSFETGFLLHPPDSKLSLLSSLSSLQLALLICAARLTNMYNTELISFALSYEEYKVLASKAKLQASASGAIGQSRVWGKDVAKGAWEELVEVGFILEDGRGTGRVDVGLEEIGMSGVELGGWGKWCKEI